MSGQSASGLPQLPLKAPPNVAVLPTKEIHAEEDLVPWLQSDAYSRLTLQVARLNAAVTNLATNAACYESEMTRKICNLLDTIDSWVDEIPLHSDPQRFGNKAFRDWGARLEAQAAALHQDIIPREYRTIMPELLEHFKGSFGSFVRIDYGSGHELAFMAYLICLFLVGLLDERDEQATITRTFERYLRICHRLQKVYCLEPAGSRGVWGLDDHQFLSYLFGSAQLTDHALFTPKAILEPSMTPLDADDLYRFSVAHVRNLKRGPFHEHSPMLDNIARTVPNWRKVNSGLLKMWRDEVLGKFPIVQHFRFGDLMSWTRDGQSLPPSRYAGTVANEGKTNLATPAAASGTKAPWAR